MTEIETKQVQDANEELKARLEFLQRENKQLRSDNATLKSGVVDLDSQPKEVQEDIKRRIGNAGLTRDMAWDAARAQARHTAGLSGNLPKILQAEVTKLTARGVGSIEAVSAVTHALACAKAKAINKSYQHTALSKLVTVPDEVLEITEVAPATTDKSTADKRQKP